jgi:hypothetical protein
MRKGKRHFISYYKKRVTPVATLLAKIAVLLSSPSLQR